MRTKIKHLFFSLQTFLRRPNYSGKVFCIGYNKTGTSSCGKAFEILGYRNKSFDTDLWRTDYKSSNFSKLLKYASKFDSFDDLPWLKEDMIPLLDEAFPGSKFVYLERDEESWSKSLYNWSYKRTGKYPDMKKELADFQKHRTFVMDYFKNRPQDLLIITISDKNSFVKLAEFLGKKTEYRLMPHENKT